MSLKKVSSFLLDPRQLYSPVAWTRLARHKEPCPDMEDVTVSFSVDLERNMRSANMFEGVESSTRLLANFLRSEGIAATFFVTGRIARRFPDMIRELSRDFEIGYHSRRHGNWGAERWDMPPPIPLAEKEQMLREDLDYFHENIGMEPVSFRAPRMNSSAETLRLLADNGFEVDSSYPAFLGGNPGIFELSLDKWPETGNSGVVEVPVSTSTKPELSTEGSLPYFKYPFLDTHTLREYGVEHFLGLCRGAGTRVRSGCLLTMFGHQWEFRSEQDLAFLKDLLRKLEPLGPRFIEIREAPALVDR